MNQGIGTTWVGRNWKWLVPTLCLVGLLVICTIAGLIFYGVTGWMKSTEAYQTALVRAKENPEVVSALGEPIVEGILMSGNINESGSSGSADMAIPISGPKDEATIYVVATQTAGKWTFSNLIVEIKKTKNRIDILEEQETPDQ